MNFVALSYPGYRLYYFGAACSINGRWILMVCFTWLAWQQSESAAFVGTVAAIGLAPSLFLGPLFGVLIDRLNVKSAYYITNIGMLLVGLALLSSELLGLTSKALIALLAFGMGVVVSANHPVRHSLGPRLVEREHVSSVVALGALSFNLSRLIAPMVCGLIIDGFGVAAAVAVAMLLNIPNLCLIWRLEPRIRTSVDPSGSFLMALRAGFHYLATRSNLLWMLLFSFLYNVSVRGTIELLTVIADGTFERGATGFGQLASAVGLGALAAALLKGILKARVFKSVSAATILVALVAAVGVAVIGRTELWFVALSAAACLGFCGTFLGITVQSAIQSDLDDDIRGRVMSLWTVVAMGGPAIGALTIGTTAQAIGMPIATLGTAILVAVGYGAIFLLQQRG